MTINENVTQSFATMRNNRPLRRFFLTLWYDYHRWWWSSSLMMIIALFQLPSIYDYYKQKKCKKKFKH